MARSRNIKPGFFKNEDLIELAFDRRLLFVGLWTIADREGRLEDRPKRIKMEVFPGDNVDIERALGDLAKAGFITRYEVSGTRYIEVSKFLKHQNPHHREPPSTIPKPEASPHLSQVQNPRLVPNVISPEPEAGPGISGTSPEPAVLIPSSLIPDSGRKALSGSPPDPLDLSPPKSNGKGHGASHEEAEAVLAYLNRATGHAYRFRNPKGGKLSPNGQVIVARMAEGYTGEQLREVVHLKAEQWRADMKMAQYLRPKTLFGRENFSQYLGELGAVSPS